MTREALARRVAPFFASHPTLPAVLDGVLRGGLGTIATDDDTQPRMARLSIGCYEVFGGDPTTPGAGRLAGAVTSGKEIVYDNRPDWRAFLLDRLGDRVSDRPMRTFDPAGLSPESLERLAASPLLEGYALRRLDASWAVQLDGELAPHGLQVFESPAAFAERGVGYGVVAGSELASAATTYTVSPASAEVAIATRPFPPPARPGHRRGGAPSAALHGGGTHAPLERVEPGLHPPGAAARLSGLRSLRSPPAPLNGAGALRLQKLALMPKRTPRGSTGCVWTSWIPSRGSPGSREP